MCVVNVASYDNYMLINSYLAFCFLLFSMTTLLQLGVDVKILSRNVVVVVVFISESPGGHVIYCKNWRVLEMQNFTPAYKKGWTYVRDDFVRTKISWMHR